MPTATAPAKTASAAPAPWKMPKPRQGMVRWSFTDGSGEECFAMVTKVYDRMIDVLVYPPGAATPQVYQGVKHVSDPSLATMVVRNPGGVFELTDFEKDVRRFLAKDGLD